MKKCLLLFVMLGFIIIVGCNNANGHPKIENGFYSSDPNKYNLLVFTDASKSSDTDWYKWEEKNNLFNEINTINGEPTTLKKAQNTYKTLKIDKLPYYVVLDTKSVVYKTSNEERLIKFLLKK